MESLARSTSTVFDYSIRKRRSSTPRRPRPFSEASHCFFPLPPLKYSTSSISDDDNHRYKEQIYGSNGSGRANKLKLKLKVGGVTHTIHTKSAADMTRESEAIISGYSSPASQQRLIFEDCRTGKYSYPSNKERANGVPCNDGPKSLSQRKSHLSRGKASGGRVIGKGTMRAEPIRKSKRVPKRRVLDVGFNSDDNDDEDAELRYLGRLNAESVAADTDSQGIYQDKYYTGEELSSDDDIGPERKKSRKLCISSFSEGGNESTPTTRKRALQFGNDALAGSSSSLLEFPNGLPPAPPKKQKEKASELDQQLKKAEAAQRRRMQSEKAAREAEAEAIRKILGQDSGRKKRVEKMKRQQDELAQEKAAKSNTLALNTVRWIIGPNGTIVTFAEDVGLPAILTSGPCSYPKPREKCVGPNCTNTYKYRDSKSKLPLCSLQCYKAMQQKMRPLVTC